MPALASLAGAVLVAASPGGPADGPASSGLTPGECPACGRPVGADGVRRSAVGGVAVQVRGG
jgi:hypothetical protein